jgi:general secretion pathway protein A
MYLRFFKFRKPPFHITPDPEFLFLSPSHKETSASILYGIAARKGFIAITGEVGVGKTTIVRSYLDRTDSRKTRIAYIFNPALSFQKLLKQVLLELGIPITDDEPSELVNSLHHYLIKEYKNDRNVVLIIDEAQNMPIETLEHIRMFSNLETSRDKLIQIILVGQPEFESMLNLPELRQLKQRIAIHSRMGPLSPSESLAYIQHRLTKASAFYNPVFTEDALKEIVKEAKGIQRTINVISDNALITAFGYQQNPVDSKIIKEVIADLHGVKPAVPLRWRASFAVSLMVIVALLFFLFSDSLNHNETSPVAAGGGVQEFQALRSGLIPKEISPFAAGPPAGTESVKPAEQEISAEPEQEVIEQQALEKSLHTSDTDQGAPSGPVIETAEAPKPETNISETYIEPEKIPAAAESVQIVQKPGPTVRIVKRGDWVFRLLLNVYGRLDEPLVKNFKDLNPQIRNLNRINIGDAVLLPVVEGSRPASN